MFGFRSRETPTLQVYGKLPLAKDYLRLGFGEAPGLAVRDWIDATFSGGGGRKAPRLAFPLRFLVGEAWGGCLQGVMVPSSDAGGLRVFPFVLGVDRQRRAMLDDVGNGLLTAGAVWRDLLQRWEQTQKHQDARGLLSAWRGATLDIAGLVRSGPGTVAFEAWLTALWPAAGRDGLEQDLDRIARVPADAPLRLPLAWGGSQRQQVAAWWEILGRLQLLPARESPTMFLPAAHTPPVVEVAADPGEGVDADATASGAGPAASQVAVEPPASAFLTVFRSPMRVEHGSWLTPSADPLGDGDLVGGRPHASLPAAPVPEGTPPLAASVRASVTNYLRHRGGQP